MKPNKKKYTRATNGGKPPHQILEELGLTAEKVRNGIPIAFHSPIQLSPQAIRALNSRDAICRSSDLTVGGRITALDAMGGIY